MFSMITNIYNKKTKGPILMELFTATGKLKTFFFWQLEMFDVCTTGDTAHIDTIFKSSCHTRVNMLTRVWQELDVRNHGEHYETPCISSFPQFLSLLHNNVTNRSIVWFLTYS